MMPRPAIRAAAAAVVALLLAGCGLGAGDAADGVTLRVTDDFGRVVVSEHEHPQQQGEDTVLRLLQRNVERVDTRYGGGFVHAIDGLTGEASGERLVDWFFYVNGVLAGRGSADWKLKAGERVWWDRHRWELAEVRAVVGSYPEPMKSGHGGRWRGALLDCRAEAATCDAAERRLRADGITVTRGDAGDDRAAQTRLVVGPWARIRGAAPELARLTKGPKESGVFVRLRGDGHPVALDSDGAAPGEDAAGGATLREGSSSLIAALRRGEGGPLWVITGGNEVAARSAVEQLDEAALAGHAAVLVTGGEHVHALPLRRGER